MTVHNYQATKIPSRVEDRPSTITPSEQTDARGYFRITTSGVEIAFQANTGSLWLWGDGTGGGDKSLGMKTGTSPAITALANGEWQAAFQANTGILWTVGNAPGSNTGNAMATGTNPSIIATGGETYALAWQSNTNNLTTMAYEGSPADSGHPMSAGTSPTLAP